MNAGFSNLDWLKKQVLAGTLASSTDFDPLIQALGLGVAAQFARYCNREWNYAAGIMEVFSGDRPHWFARRAPVTQFTKVELRFFMADPWTNITGQPVSVDEEKGYIDFGYTLGRRPMQTRLTYNGGFWWEQLEPDDVHYPSAIPTDITNNDAGIDPAKFNLPDDLKLAWLIQCKHIWKNQDKLGTDVLKGGADASVRFPESFALTVEQTLQSYIRYQLT